MTEATLSKDELRKKLADLNAQLEQAKAARDEEMSVSPAIQ